MIRQVFVYAAVLYLTLSSAQAADAPPAGAADNPLEISADQGLVWDRANKSYTAKGRAEVRQGDMRVTADQIVARYNGDDSASDIQTVTAEGNVALSQPPYTAYGDRADYDVVSGRAILTGADLRIVTPDERLTAQDRITYDAAAGQMTAEGGAVMTRGTDSLAAQTLTARFATDATGTRALDTVTATGGVTIKTPRETITGKRGLYRGASQQAELTGDVVIVQDKNRLQGTRATVDMKTGLSKLFGSGAGDGRVRGVFYPKSSPKAAAPPVVPAAIPAPAAPSAAPAASPVAAQEKPSAVASPVAETPAPPAAPLPDEPFTVPTTETQP